MTSITMRTNFGLACEESKSNRLPGDVYVKEFMIRLMGFKSVVARSSAPLEKVGIFQK